MFVPTNNTYGTDIGAFMTNFVLFFNSLLYNMAYQQIQRWVIEIVTKLIIVKSETAKSVADLTNC